MPAQIKREVRCVAGLCVDGVQNLDLLADVFDIRITDFGMIAERCHVGVIALRVQEGEFPITGIERIFESGVHTQKGVGNRDLRQRFVSFVEYRRRLRGKTPGHFLMDLFDDPVFDKTGCRVERFAFEIVGRKFAAVQAVVQFLHANKIDGFLDDIVFESIPGDLERPTPDHVLMLRHRTI